MISEEQLKDIGVKCHRVYNGTTSADDEDCIALARKAYELLLLLIADLLPLIAKELLREPTNAEAEEFCNYCNDYYDGTDASMNSALTNFFANRLTAVTRKPDPLRDTLAEWIAECDLDAALAAVKAAMEATNAD